MEFLVHQVLNRYRLDSLLGEGGMGAVFKAHDLTLDRDVAVKVMHSNFARQTNFQNRFLQEARTAARLNHPGIVKVYDFGQHEGMLYIVMEFIPGCNLSQLTTDFHTRGKWPLLHESVEIIRQVSLAIDYAHKNAVLHRDIKPGNIMLKPTPSNHLSYTPIVTDLGLAKLAEGGLAATQTGIAMGTPTYMSPEQAMGQKVDARSDVYSLGILLYELCVGKPPFNAHSLVEAIRCHCQTPPPPPSSLRPELPKDLEIAILKAIAKKPQQRFQSAEKLAKALKSCLSSTSRIHTAPKNVAEAVSLMTELAQTPDIPAISNEFDKLALSGLVRQDMIQLGIGDGTRRSIMIQGDNLDIGRSANCAVVLTDSQASRHHARVNLQNGRYYVTDLNSTNGTYLNNKRLPGGVAAEWKPEFPLQIGSAVMRLIRPNLPAAISAETGKAPRPASTPQNPSFSTQISPSIVEKNTPAQIHIHNQSNVSQTFLIHVEPQDEEIHISPPNQQVKVPAQNSVQVQFQISHKKFRFLGSRREHPFTARIHPHHGKDQHLAGQYQSQALLPVWAFSILTVLLIASTLVMGWWWQNQSNQSELAAADQIETQVAATFIVQTIEALSDNDQDGLSNQREAELGTDPDNADSDGDGLSDNLEVNQVQTDPLNADSDGDGFSDGEEVNLIGSDPNVPNPSSDELITPTDPTPEITPTMTPLPTHLPTETPTTVPTLVPTQPVLILSTTETRHDESVGLPNYRIDGEFPQFWGANSNINAGNQAIEDDIDAQIQTFKEGLSDASVVPEITSTLDFTSEIYYNEANLISVKFEYQKFYGGSMRPWSYNRTISYDLETGTQLQLDDLFTPGSLYLPALADYCQAEIESWGDDYSPEGARAEESNYERWNLTRDGLYITFDPYQVGPGVAGSQHVLVPYETMDAYIHAESPINRIR